jgi:hypothetical protein
MSTLSENSWATSRVSIPKTDTSPTWLSHILRWPTHGSRDWALRALPQLCSNPNVMAVVLIGSTIRPAESSYDLDCLYIYRGGRPVLPRTPNDVDARGFDATQVDELITRGHDLLVWSLKLGRLVCERDSYWSHLCDRWLVRLPFPSADIADRRAVKAEEILRDLRDIGDNDAAVEQLVTALSHRARAALLRARVFPASRPELPEQLRQIGEPLMADSLEAAIRERNALAHQSMVGTSRTAGDAA